MKNPVKFFAALFITLVFSVSLFGVNAYAAENTLGFEEPYLYCEFFDENNQQVDGNALTSGDYTVNVMLEGMESLSVFQYTVWYDTSVVTDISTEVVITDTYSDLSLGGTKTTDLGNGISRFVLALASTDDACTALDQGGAVTVSSMTVTVDCGENVIDFIDYFDFVTDPDLTFIEADYGDGIEDAYVLDTTVSTTYETYLMTADVTPPFGAATITVSGRISIAGDSTGSATEYGLRGVKVYAYDNNDNVIAETVSNSSGEASTWGEYSLEVPVGTTQFMVGDYNSDTIINRPFTIAGDADVTDADVAVIMCDYNDDGVVNSMDKAEFNGYYKGGYYTYADFNDDNSVNSMDKAEFNGIYKTCQNGASYTANLYFE